ncbi:NAD(P)/FAD-dependent oxidoreductase [Moraxella canis]|uniref:NAD(P)/FAD-dependent oxidoreductase n=1 Tax=Moraxella canis TaxID=90239 RepID=A0ABZ0X039_9GAMM|nr:NAD(P)/FAD-dependent oxidoreductase [Moraxella canis]WQE04690.1 NAD(P)/FAD-dependent oxidoreductase [Moraxella canis]
MSISVDTLIIGAGASGLFCAFNAAAYGKSVLVIDHANKAGKKILMSGGGRCNFINRQVEPRHFISQNPHFVKSALSKYQPEDFIALVDRHQVAYQEREYGQLFCKHSAKDILAMLLNECRTAGVQIRLDTAVERICANDAGFMVSTKHKRNDLAITIQASSLVIATGGLSIPTLGASGFGYQVATQFGHQIIPTRAGLVPFTFTDKTGEMIKSLAGLSLDVVAYNDKASFALPMLFTHRGLSGPAMLQLSNYWQLGEHITIDLLPHQDMIQYLLDAKRAHPKQLIRTALTPLLPKKLITALEALLWQAYQDTELANLKDDIIRHIGAQLNAWTLKPSGTEGYRVAEVTLGGVDTREVSGKTMESRLQPNLYFIGEVLDVTGWLGGYNFAWAWASAYACAESIGMRW